MKPFDIIPERHKVQNHTVLGNFFILRKKLNFLIYFTAASCVAHTVLPSRITNKGNSNLALLNGKLIQK